MQEKSKVPTLKVPMNETLKDADKEKFRQFMAKLPKGKVS